MNCSNCEHNKQKGIACDQCHDQCPFGNWTPMICPICKKEIVGYPALSRKDNKTEICSDCGTREALEDFFEKK